MAMSATQMIIDNGFISEDVVKYVILEYLVEGQAHWKKLFKNCIEELERSWEEEESYIYTQSHTYSISRSHTNLHSDHTQTLTYAPPYTHTKIHTHTHIHTDWIGGMVDRIHIFNIKNEN